MHAMAIDTLKFAKHLKDAGVPEVQAEAQAEALVEAFDRSHEELATKADLRELALKINAQMLKVNAEQQQLKWMIGILLAGVLSLVMKAFFIA
jgi:hypothetical protein